MSEKNCADCTRRKFYQKGYEQGKKDVCEQIIKKLEQQAEQYYRREKDFENINVTVQIHSKYYGKARSYEHAINIVKEELGLEPY